MGRCLVLLWMRELLGAFLGSSLFGGLFGLGGLSSSLGDLGDALLFLGLVLGSSSLLLGLLGIASGFLGVLLGALFLGSLLGSTLLGGLGGLLGGGSLLGGLLGGLALLELVGGGTELVGEALDTSAGIDELLLTREERMALVAEINDELGLGRAGLEGVAAPCTRRNRDGYRVSLLLLLCALVSDQGVKQSKI